MIKNTIVRFFLISLFFLSSLVSFSQVQEYYSYKNSISRKRSKSNPPASRDTMRISFVPTEGHDYRTLIIGPKGTLKDAIDKSFALPLVRKVTDRISNRVRTIHYEAQNENAETTVIIESREDILTSITVSTKYPDFTIDWKFIDLKPTFRN